LFDKKTTLKFISNYNKNIRLNILYNLYSGLTNIFSDRIYKNSLTIYKFRNIDKYIIDYIKYGNE
jgi:hypothetical protein